MSASIYIPVIQSRYVIQGLFSEPRWQALLASGAMDFSTIEAVFGDRKVGDFVNIPQYVQVPTPIRVDLTSTTAGDTSVFTPVSTNNAKAPVLRDYTPYSWQRHDEIRTGEDMSRLASETVGNKIAQRLINQMHRVLQGALGVAGLNHIYDQSLVGGDSGAMTVQALRKTKSLLGQQGGTLDTMIIHSKVWYDLVYDLIANYKYMGETSGMIIQDGQLDRLMGIKTIIVSDDLTSVAGSGSDSTLTEYYTYLFAPGAVYWAYQSAPMVEQFVDVRVPSTLFSEKVSFDYVVQPKGFAFNGTSNPLDTDLSTSSNWAQANENSQNVGVVACTSLGAVH